MHATTQIILTLYGNLWNIYNWNQTYSAASFNQEHNNPFSPQANSKQKPPPIQNGKNLRSILIELRMGFMQVYSIKNSQH